MSLARFPAPLLVLPPLLLAAPSSAQAPDGDSTQSENSSQRLELDACITAHESGQEQRMSGRLLAARDHFRKCSAPACPAEMRKQCTEWQMELRSEIPSIVLVVRDQSGQDRSDAVVVLDGQDRGRAWVGASLEVDPGKHNLQVKVGNGTILEQTFVAAPGESRRLVSVRVDDPTRPAPSRTKSPPTTESPPYLGYVLLGVGAVALGTSAALWLSAKSDLDEFKSTCSPRCDPGDVDAAERKALFSDIALAVGVVGVAGGSYLVLSSGPSAPGDAGFSVSAHGRF